MMSSSTHAAIRHVTAQKTLLHEFETERTRLRIERSSASVAWEAARLVLDHATAELQRVEELCDSLTSSISAAQQKIMSRSIAGLPVELLRAIFEAVVFADDGEWAMDGDDEIDILRKDSPFHLASACRRWREVALGTPSVWNYIAVPQLSSRVKLPNPDELMRYFKLLVVRSKNSPLDIVIHWHLDEKITQKHYDILELLANEHRRWRRMIFRWPNMLHPSSADPMWRMFYLPTPQLESLFLSQPNPELVWESEGAYPAYFPDRRRLRHFVSTSSNMMWMNPQPLHRSLLTRVELMVEDYMPPSTIWSLLKECASTLEEVRLNALLFPFATNTPPQSSLTLPVLHTLRGAGRSEDLFAHWTGYIIAPKLATFSNDDGDISTCASFIADTCKNITQLELVGSVLSAESAVALRPLTRLTTLVIEWFPPDSEFLDALASPLPGDDIWMCPNLRTVVMEGKNTDVTDIPLLARVLRNRRMASIEGHPGAPARITAVEYRNHCKINQVSRFILAAALADDAGSM